MWLPWWGMKKWIPPTLNFSKSSDKDLLAKWFFFHLSFFSHPFIKFSIHPSIFQFVHPCQPQQNNKTTLYHITLIMPRHIHHTMLYPPHCTMLHHTHHSTTPRHYTTPHHTSPTMLHQPHHATHQTTPHHTRSFWCARTRAQMQDICMPWKCSRRPLWRVRGGGEEDGWNGGGEERNGGLKRGMGEMGYCWGDYNGYWWKWVIV